MVLKPRRNHGSFLEDEEGPHRQVHATRGRANWPIGRSTRREVVPRTLYVRRHNKNLREVHLIRAYLPPDLPPGRRCLRPNVPPPAISNRARALSRSLARSRRWQNWPPTYSPSSSSSSFAQHGGCAARSRVSLAFSESRLFRLSFRKTLVLRQHRLCPQHRSLWRIFVVTSDAVAARPRDPESDRAAHRSRYRTPHLPDRRTAVFEPGSRGTPLIR